MVTHPFLQNAGGLPLELKDIFDEKCPHCPSTQLGVISQNDRSESVHCVRCDWMTTRHRRPRTSRKVVTHALAPGQLNWRGEPWTSASLQAFAKGPWPMTLEDSSVILAVRFDGETLLCQIDKPWME